MNRLRNFKLILWTIAGMGAAVAAARMLLGLGTTTNLSDGVPWGLWIGFDVMGGVALAAGGFVVTATVYIFRREAFHPIVRPAVLTAFLGYIAVIIGLLFDLGLPWHIWRPMVSWQHHSVLFEVAWCVMLYTSVLALEFSPVPLEATSRYAKIRATLIKIRLPLVIVGICLSTLHQSSLGSLFLIMPYRLHPLWYSPILPVLFFVSAVALGLMMVSLEGLATSYLYRREPETNLIAKLGIGARWVLLFYVALRLGDLVVRGKAPELFQPTRYALLFWVELTLAALGPMALLWINRVRTSTVGQWVIALSGVVGLVLNRISVSGLAQIRAGVPAYFPGWGEFAVSGGIVAAAILAFLFAVERFTVWEERPDMEPGVSLGGRGIHILGRLGIRLPLFGLKLDSSLAFVLAAAFAFAAITGDRATARGIPAVPVHRARGGDTLWIDGNLDGFGARFTHRSHMRGCYRGPRCTQCHEADPMIAQGRRSGDSMDDPTCAMCHHMNLPRDRNTACATCHRSMYHPTDAFGHQWHSSPDGANLTCYDCHVRGEPKSADNAKKCMSCHHDLVPPGSTIKFTDYMAPGYVDAMHQLCIGCHHNKADIMEEPDLARCTTCHPGQRDFVDAADIATRFRHPMGKRVVLPLLGEK